MDKNLNIVTLDVPYPADYGGMIDTYHRIRHLHAKGIKIHLHCFTSGRAGSEELRSVCESVHYYRRKTGLLRHLSPLPFIVSSRISGRLRKNLMTNSYPILFDGLHSAYLLGHHDFSDRKKYLRAHNIEQNYYSSRAKHETNPVRKLYFILESIKLRRFEKIITRADTVFAISNPDLHYFEKLNRNVILIAPFHPFDEVQSRPGSGEYVLYHGDLSVNENGQMAEMLTRNVFAELECKCILAGKNPSSRLRSVVKGFSNVSLVADPSQNEMAELIQNAHINLVPAAEPDGFKIKLLFALFGGRHCIGNKTMAVDPALEGSLIITDNPEEMISAAKSLFKVPFTNEMIRERVTLMELLFNNVRNAGRMIDAIFHDIRIDPS